MNNLVAKNIVSLDFGGGIFLSNQDRGNIFLTNNTITENASQSSDGGGLYIELFTASSTIDLYNNIILSVEAARDSVQLLWIYLFIVYLH